jgi:hypothetical protein
VSTSCGHEESGPAARVVFRIHLIKANEHLNRPLADFFGFPRSLLLKKWSTCHPFFPYTVRFILCTYA